MISDSLTTFPSNFWSLLSDSWSNITYLGNTGELKSSDSTQPFIIDSTTLTLHLVKKGWSNCTVVSPTQELALQLIEAEEEKFHFQGIILTEHRSTGVSKRVLKKLNALGPVVRMPVSVNPGLKFNWGFPIFLSKALCGIIFSILFRVSNHQIVRKEN